MNTPTTYNIAISGTFDVENYGDLMFPIMAEHELRRRLGSIRLTRYSYLEKVAHSWPYDVTPLSKLNADMSDHAGLLIGGGHLIRFDKDVAQGYYPSDGETHHPTGYWLTPALAAANAGVPIFWNGPSASLDTPAWGAPLLRAALSMSEYVAVRDESTAKEMRRIGYSGQCSIVSDTVFGLPGLLPLEEARKRAAPLLEQAGVTGPYIVVQAKSELADIARALAAHPDTRDLQILVVAIGPILGEHPSLIIDAVPEAKSLNFWPAPLDIAALIAASAGTVAISLHLTITSLCYGLPVLRYSRTRLTKYEFIEASKNVFLHGGGDEPLPADYIAHLTVRKPCAIVQQVKSVLDAHWEYIARSLAAKHKSDKVHEHRNFFRVWNTVMAQAETLANDAQAEIAASKEIAASRDQALNELNHEREVGRKSYEMLIAKQAQLEARIAEDADSHRTRITGLTEKLETLTQSLTSVLEHNKTIQHKFNEKERELREGKHKLDHLHQLVIERDALLQDQSYELLIAKQMQLETQIAEDTHSHQARIMGLTEELETLKQLLANVLKDNKAIQHSFDEKERELQAGQHKLEQLHQLVVEQDARIQATSDELLLARQTQLETQIVENAREHQATITNLTEELEGLKHFLANALEENRAAQLSFEAKEQELREGRHELDRLHQLVIERDAHIQNMLRSRSWRLTLPLRGGATLARRIKNKVLFKRPDRSRADAAVSIDQAQLPAPATIVLEQPSQGSPIPVTRDEPFDAQFYVANNPDVAGSGMDPYQHYIEFGKAEERAGIPPPLMLPDLSSPEIAPQDEPFDAEFYVDNYPDVAESGMDPYQHYIHFGKAEERLGVPPPLMLTENAAATHEGRDYVLVVCHDATRTGAPILGWNICRELGKRYNVIALLLGDGDIAGHFADDCAVLAGPYDKSVRTPKAIGRTIADLHAHFNLAFAIVNSIASRSVLRPLAEQYVPSVLLVHEFSKFHCYPDEIVDTFGWAGEVVFPAKLVQQNASLERTEPAVRRSHIVPQGQSVIPLAKTDDSAAARNKAERERQELIRQVLPQGEGADRPFIVLGAGTIEYRKGVDLFIATAAKLKSMATDRKILMVWVGRTYDSPEHRQYRTYLDDQIVASDLQDDLIMLDETPHLEALYGIADLFYVSARLDPLPNVAIDAMTMGLPLICFENATGVAEILAADGSTRDCVLPYLQVHAATQAILDISASLQKQKQISQACKFLADATFDLPQYVRKLESLATTATTATYQRRADELALDTSDSFARDFYQPRRSSESAAQAPHIYLKQSQSRIYVRKPAPGFNPLAYAEHTGLIAADCDPYLHWLQSGQPQGPWQQSILNLAQADLNPTTGLRTGVHIHAYYPDLLDSILDRMELNQLECDYLISAPNASAVAEVEKVLATKPYRHRCLLRQTTNRGRDIGPFFTGFAKELRDYDVVGHFHTKKSPHVTLSNLVPDWIEFLLENMLGGKFRSADSILSAFAKDEKLGLVFADDPHLIGWDKNRSFATSLAEKMQLAPLTDGFFPFPVGTMFWARAAALAPVFDLNLGWEDYPSEPLPIDGSMLHALERLLPRVVEHAGYTHRSTYAPGVTR